MFTAQGAAKQILGIIWGLYGPYKDNGIHLETNHRESNAFAFIFIPELQRKSKRKNAY